MIVAGSKSIYRHIQAKIESVQLRLINRIFGAPPSRTVWRGAAFEPIGMPNLYGRFADGEFVIMIKVAKAGLPHRRFFRVSPSTARLATSSP